MGTVMCAKKIQYNYWVSVYYQWQAVHKLHNKTIFGRIYLPTKHWYNTYGGNKDHTNTGSSFNGTRWTVLGKYHHRWRNVVFRLRSGHQTTECRVGGAKLSKTKETVISKIASEDDVDWFFQRRRYSSSRVCPWWAESKCRILRGCFGSATEENSTS